MCRDKIVSDISSLLKDQDDSKYAIMAREHLFYRVLLSKFSYKEANLIMDEYKSIFDESIECVNLGKELE